MLVVEVLEGLHAGGQWPCGVAHSAGLHLLRIVLVEVCLLRVGEPYGQNLYEVSKQSLDALVYRVANGRAVHADHSYLLPGEEIADHLVLSGLESVVLEQALEEGYVGDALAVEGRRFLVRALSEVVDDGMLPVEVRHDHTR